MAGLEVCVLYLELPLITLSQVADCDNFLADCGQCDSTDIWWASCSVYY